jgi:23S rRNA (cytidine1920-2'-O)/16S rRNA (cytidine1409-2'-O)-methyltransferase
VPFVSRAGEKLDLALRHFALPVQGLVCADLGCSTGGFTGYGVLAYKLRTDPRVTVLERTNALHAPAHAPCDLVVCDLSWTVQRFAVPSALRWLAPAPHARIVTLIKPHYERSSADPHARGILTDDQAHQLFQATLDTLPAMGVSVLGSVLSPIRGSGGKHKEGNLEWLALLARA